MEETRKPRCHNCIFGGAQFKIVNLTHLHCFSPQTLNKFETDENYSAWDSLRIFSDKCSSDEHKFKPPKTAHPESQPPNTN